MTGDERQRARASVLAKWEKTEEWVTAVHTQMEGEPEIETTIREPLEQHTALLCPGGALSAEFTASLKAP